MKARAKISAAEEVREILAKAWKAEDHKKINSPTDAFIHPKIQALVVAKAEHFAVAALDSQHKIIGVKVITIGLVNRSLAHPREIFRYLIVTNASSCILIHNHPSGEVDPSPEDISVTKRLVDAGSIIGIAVIDHLIVGKSGYYSMVSNGEILGSGLGG